MRLDLSDDQQLFQETVRRFLQTETPIDVVRGRIGHGGTFDRAWWRRAAELGFAAMLAPESAGGGSISGCGPADLAIVAEELGRSMAPSPVLPVNVVAGALGRHVGTGGPLVEEVLADVVAGALVATWAGADGGIELADDGRGPVLHGVASAVEAADQADVLLVTAGPDDAPSQFLVRADAPGVTIEVQRSLDLLRRFGRVTFDGARPAATVGARGAAAADVAWQRTLAALILCAEMAGCAARVFEFTLEYAFDRYSFGRPLASYQALKHRFADMKMWVEASHAICDVAAEAFADGIDPAGRVSAAKAYVGDRAVDVIQDCVQMHGGIGVTWEHDIHLFLRRATVNRGRFGDPSHHRDRLARLVATRGTRDGRV